MDQTNTEASNRALATKALKDLFTLTEEQREALLRNNQPYTLGLLNLLFKGFVEVDQKYDHILLMSAQMYHSITQVNKLLGELIDITDESFKANISVADAAREIGGNNPGAEWVAGLLDQNARIFNAVELGVAAIIGGGESTLESFIKTDSVDNTDTSNTDSSNTDSSNTDSSNTDNNTDRIFSTDFREALAFYLNKRNAYMESNPLLDSDIDEAALNAALTEWSKNLEN